MMIEVESTVKLVVRVDHYSPARPAPACDNPSDPAYSDPGDSEEIEFTMFLKSTDGTLTEATDQSLYDAVAESVFDYISEYYK
jgi:hypothetical protein